MAKQKKAKQIETKASTSARAVPILTHGRVFEGFVIKKYSKRVVIETEKTLYVPKYERFYKKKLRMHARLPATIDVGIGDLIQIQECRPLSKLIHAIVIKKVSTGGEGA